MTLFVNSPHLAKTASSLINLLTLELGLAIRLIPT